MAQIFSSIKESLTSVMPIALIVIILSATCVSLDAGVFVLFFIRNDSADFGNEFFYGRFGYIYGTAW